MEERRSVRIYRFFITLPDRFYPFATEIEGQWVRGVRSYNQALQAAFDQYGAGHYGARLILYRSLFHIVGSVAVIVVAALVFQDAFGSKVALYAVLVITALFIAFQEFYLQRGDQSRPKAIADWVGWVGPMVIYIFFR